MKNDFNCLKKRHLQAVMYEINMVSDSLIIEHRLKLIKLYSQLKLDQAVQSELNRLWQKNPQHQAVLAAMLDLFTNQKKIALLTTMVNLAQKIVDPSVSLRLAIANALVAMRRYDDAVLQYVELLKSYEIIPRLLQRLAEFVCVYPPTSDLITALNAYVYNMHQNCFPPLLNYVLCRTQEIQDSSDIDKYLNCIQASDIRQPEIVFDLARLSFRFCKWGRAVTAAKRVLMISPQNEPAKSMLASAYSFAGRLNKATNCIRNLTKVSPSLIVSSDQMSAVWEYIERKHMGLSAVDKASGPQPEINDSIVIDSGSQKNHYPEFLDLQREQKRKLTFSVIETDSINARPWDILVPFPLNKFHFC